MKRFIKFSLVLVMAVSAPMAFDYAQATPSLVEGVAAPDVSASTAPLVFANSAPDRELAKANYDLASRWTSAKVGKYVFSTAVTPHWLEFSDRFWYDYETPSGR